MKKSMVFVISLLIVLILSLKYMERSSEKKRDLSPARSDLKSEGVSLPDDARSHDYDNIKVPVQNIVGVEKLALLPEKYGKIGMCKNGTVNEILKGYSKIWGYATGRTGSISNNEKNEKLYSLVSELFACIGIVDKDYSYCDYLPGGGITYGDSLITEQSNLKCRCEVKMFDAAAVAYMTGLSKDAEHCVRYVSSDACSSGNEDQEVISLLKNIDKGEFCKMMGKGMKGLLSSSVRLDPKLDKAKFSCYFPKNSVDCRKCADDEKKECLETAAKYKAFKGGDFNKCPDKMCEAFLRRSPKTCEAIAEKLSKTYCAYYKDLLKVTGNAPGMSDDEISQHAAQLEAKGIEERKLKAEERIKAEKDEKENEKEIKEVNDRVKKILGKE